MLSDKADELSVGAALGMRNWTCVGDDEVEPDEELAPEIEQRVVHQRDGEDVVPESEVDQRRRHHQVPRAAVAAEVRAQHFPNGRKCRCLRPI